ncbi:copper amine oxidase N-terminal domain-containing protein [Paenibacillus sp. MER TA 81-3]|uniref:copper amine oxidase N-terminal domain-containing protein n=1 Tax=Paenibacillus sp. MER TA 81-3 TaxID=2939573 RepID=UPI00203FCC33|nr:copper amine oxidase N-terminal domain-containing protein [Paenibacillus sp. MER TA 81-3]MCM3339914.1 copper amine oxidase N-terminal domain-containing protein [Paenibacillus sp. MER TA 81-3]
MKKIVSFVIAGTMAIGSFPGLISTASALKYDATQRALEIVLDGNKIPFQEVRPMMDANNRTLVPLRVVSENLGAKVKWDGKSKKAMIQKGDARIEMKVNDSTAYINGEATTFDSRMVMIGSSTFVPLRFVSEAFGTEVEFDKGAYYVYVKTPGFEKADVKLDEYGREIRTTNLPKNHKDFPYILKDIPNEMYEVPLHIEKGEEDKFMNPLKLLSEPHINRVNVDAWKEKIEEYYGLVLNVDYKNIDYNWAKQVRNYENMLGGDGEMKAYVDWVKRNKIKVEGSLVAEPSLVYDDGLHYRMRTKYKFRITNFDRYKDLIYDSSFHLEKNNNGKLLRYEKDVWYEGYADIPLGSNINGAHYTPNLMLSTPSLFLDNAVVKASK